MALTLICTIVTLILINILWCGMADWWFEWYEIIMLILGNIVVGALCFIFFSSLFLGDCKWL